jgi:thiol-disulfide isomerase/thioredoxin
VRRRAFLAGVGSVGVVGGAGCLGGGSAESGDAGGGGDGGDRNALPLTVETLDAPGSQAGSQRIPAAGTPTVVDLFATWCAPCKAQMESLRSLHDEFGDRVAFVSVTNERFGGGLTAEDVREWWVEHDGNWTVGHDPESRLMRVLGAGGLPFLVVTDADGTVAWTHRGIASESNLRERVSAVL